MTLVAILVFPLLASILCWTPAIGRKVASALTLVNCVALLGLAVWATHRVIVQGRVVAIPGWIEMDALGALILLLVTAVGVTASLYSLGYMKRTTHDASVLHHYYGNFNLFIFSMVAVPVVVGPSVAWLAVELTTLLSVLLVGFESNREALEELLIAHFRLAREVVEGEIHRRVATGESVESYEPHESTLAILYRIFRKGCKADGLAGPSSR